MVLLEIHDRLYHGIVRDTGYTLPRYFKRYTIDFTMVLLEIQNRPYRGIVRDTG